MQLQYGRKSGDELNQSLDLSIKIYEVSDKVFANSLHFPIYLLMSGTYLGRFFYICNHFFSKMNFFRGYMAYFTFRRVHRYLGYTVFSLFNVMALFLDFSMLHAV